MFVHTFGHLQPCYPRVAPLPDRFGVRIGFVLRIVSQDGIDREALNEIEDCPHSGEGLRREVVMGRVKRQNALEFGLIQTEQIGLRCGCFFE